MMPTIVLTLLALTVAAVDPSPIAFHYPRWSPDGRWLLLTANTDGDDEIWIVARDGTGRQRLTDNAIDDSSADWHADGRRIVFQRHDRGRVEHYVMDRDGSNVRRFEPEKGLRVKELTVEERRSGIGQAVFVSRAGAPGWRISRARWAEGPAVSPDGYFVAFEQREDPIDVLGSDIAIWDGRSDSIRILGRGTDPSWSSDGRSLMFKAPRGANNDPFILIADVVGGTTRVIAQGVHPHLSPDGKSIAYVADGPDRADVFVIGVDGQQKRCVTCEWR